MLPQKGTTEEPAGTNGFMVVLAWASWSALSLEEVLLRKAEQGLGFRV